MIFGQCSKASENYHHLRALLNNMEISTRGGDPKGQLLSISAMTKYDPLPIIFYAFNAHLAIFIIEPPMKLIEN